MRWGPKGGMGTAQSDSFSGFSKEASKSREHLYCWNSSGPRVKYFHFWSGCSSFYATLAVHSTTKHATLDFFIENERGYKLK
jgi:hypothetical protein